MFGMEERDLPAYVSRSLNVYNLFIFQGNSAVLLMTRRSRFCTELLFEWDLLSVIISFALGGRLPAV